MTVTNKSQHFRDIFCFLIKNCKPIYRSIERHRTYFSSYFNTDTFIYVIEMHSNLVSMKVRNDKDPWNMYSSARADAVFSKLVNKIFYQSAL